MSAISCLANICRLDPKSAAATREAQGLGPLVGFLRAADPDVRARPHLLFDLTRANVSSHTQTRASDTG